MRNKYKRKKPRKVPEIALTRKRPEKEISDGRGLRILEVGQTVLLNLEAMEHRSDPLLERFAKIRYPGRITSIIYAPGSKGLHHFVKFSNGVEDVFFAGEFE